MAPWHRFHSPVPPSEEGRSALSCPPTPTPPGALAFPQLAPLSTTATWPNQVSQENKEQINRDKIEWDYEEKNKKRGKHAVPLRLNSSLFYSRLLYSKLCMKGGTLSVLTAANICMPAWLNTHIPTDMRALKGQGHWAYCGHVPRLPQKCHITVLIQPVRCSDTIFSFFNSPYRFLSETRFPFLSLIVFVFSASHSFFHLSPFASSFYSCPSLHPSLFGPIIFFLFFPLRLILRVHSVKTKIHQKSGGIATDRTAVCVCVCVLWSRQWHKWFSLSERFQPIFQLIGKHKGTPFLFCFTSCACWRSTCCKWMALQKRETKRTGIFVFLLAR